MDLALFILRLTAGLLLASHGAHKLFGWFAAVAVAGGPGTIALDNVYETALPSGSLRIGGLVVLLGWLLARFTSTLTAAGESASTT